MSKAIRKQSRCADPARLAAAAAPPGRPPRDRACREASPTGVLSNSCSVQVSEVLLEHDAAAPVDVDGRGHRQAVGLEQPAHREVGKLLGNERLRVERQHAALPRRHQPVVAPRRSIAGERNHFCLGREPRLPFGEVAPDQRGRRLRRGQAPVACAVTRSPPMPCRRASAAPARSAGPSASSGNTITLSACSPVRTTPPVVTIDRKHAGAGLDDCLRPQHAALDAGTLRHSRPRAQHRAPNGRRGCHPRSASRSGPVRDRAASVAAHRDRARDGRNRTTHPRSARPRDGPPSARRGT